MSVADREARDRQLFNEIAAKYARKDIEKSTAMIRRRELMIAFAPLLKAQDRLGTILEVGCGVGAPSWHLDGLYDAYVGLDYSSEIIKIAEQLRVSERVSFLVADAKDVVLDKPVDVVFGVGVLHHMAELEEALVALKRYATPQTRFVFIEPHCLNPIAQLLRRIRQKTDKSYSEEQVFFDPEALAGIFRRLGFVEVRYEFEGFLATPFGEVVLRPHWLFRGVSALLLGMDSVLDRLLPGFLRRFSWGFHISARIPETAS